MLFHMQGPLFCAHRNALRARRDCGSGILNRLTSTHNSVQSMEINVSMNLDWFIDVFRYWNSFVSSQIKTRFFCIRKQVWIVLARLMSWTETENKCSHFTIAYAALIRTLRTHKHIHTHTCKPTPIPIHLVLVSMHADAHTNIGRTKWHMSESKTTQTHNKWLYQWRRCAVEKVWYRSVDPATRLHNIRCLNLSSGIVLRASKIHDEKTIWFMLAFDVTQTVTEVYSGNYFWRKARPRAWSVWVCVRACVSVNEISDDSPLTKHP